MSSKSDKKPTDCGVSGANVEAPPSPIMKNNLFLAQLKEKQQQMLARGSIDLGDNQDQNHQVDGSPPAKHDLNHNRQDQRNNQQQEDIFKERDQNGNRCQENHKQNYQRQQSTQDQSNKIGQHQQQNHHHHHHQQQQQQTQQRPQQQHQHKQQQKPKLLQHSSPPPPPPPPPPRTPAPTPPTQQPNSNSSPSPNQQKSPNKQSPGSQYGCVIVSVGTATQSATMQKKKRRAPRPPNIQAPLPPPPAPPATPVAKKIEATPAAPSITSSITSIDSPMDRRRVSGSLTNSPPESLSPLSPRSSVRGSPASPSIYSTLDRDAALDRLSAGPPKVQLSNFRITSYLDEIYNRI